MNSMIHGKSPSENQTLIKNRQFEIIPPDIFITVKIGGQLLHVSFS